MLERRLMNAPVRVSDFSEPRPLSRIHIEPSSAVLGAEVHGVDLREELSADQVAELRQALIEHKVLFFRDQDISHDDHVRFGRYFGPLEGHPVTQHLDGHPEILRIRNGEYAYLNEFTIPFIRPINKWHADVTFRPAPSLGGVLRARQIPPRGGDTLFVDAEAVFNDLAKPFQARLEGLTATHDILKSYGWKLNDEEKAKLTAEHPPQSHPVVRVHPESGRKSIFVNHGFTTKIDGVEQAESDEILALLFDRVRVPEYQVRFSWSPNAIAFWDNRATQHYPIADYFPHDREVERVTIAGDVPFGVS
jgi:taurine dioxygenase